MKILKKILTIVLVLLLIGYAAIYVFIASKGKDLLVVKLSEIIGKRVAVGSLQFGLMQIFFVLAALIVVINVVLTYAQVDTFAVTAQKTSDAFSSVISMMVSAFDNLFGAIQFEGFYIVLAVTSLLILFLIDRFVLQPRFKTSS